jgi:hypothetical protein
MYKDLPLAMECTHKQRANGVKYMRQAPASTSPWKIWHSLLLLILMSAAAYVVALEIANHFIYAQGKAAIYQFVTEPSRRWRCGASQY